jgi:hypothetical protein
VGDGDTSPLEDTTSDANSTASQGWLELPTVTANTTLRTDGSGLFSALGSAHFFLSPFDFRLRAF